MSTVKDKRAVKIGERTTSVVLSDAGWAQLKTIAVARGMSRYALVAVIDADRGEVGLSHALRQFLNGEAAKTAPAVAGALGAGA